MTFHIKNRYGKISIIRKNTEEDEFTSSFLLSQRFGGIENERNKIIHNVINGLRKSQKTKLIKYYFEEKTEEEIAKEENMTQQAISKGLELAKENFGHTFRKKFKKF